MKLLAGLLSATIVVAFVLPAQAANYPAAQCQSWFKANDRNRDGTLGIGENVGKFYDRITLANEDDDSFIMSRAFFIAECKIGSFGRPPA
jgi:hypothetical protein